MAVIFAARGRCCIPCGVYAAVLIRAARGRCRARVAVYAAVFIRAACGRCRGLCAGDPVELMTVELSPVQNFLK